MTKFIQKSIDFDFFDHLINISINNESKSIRFYSKFNECNQKRIKKELKSGQKQFKIIIDDTILMPDFELDQF